MANYCTFKLSTDIEKKLNVCWPKQNILSLHSHAILSQLKKLFQTFQWIKSRNYDVIGD